MSDSDTPSLRLRADELHEAGRPAEAAVLYQKLVEENPAEDSPLLCLAWALNDSGQRPEAIECFEKLFSRELTRGLIATFAFDELVRLYSEEENLSALLRVCRRAALARPEDTGILQTLAEACLRAGHPEEAVDIFTKIANADPDAPEAWGELGGALIAAGRIEQGEEAYRRAAQIDPEATIAYLDRLACALMNSGYPEKAMAVWRRCTALQPDNPVYEMAVGECCVCLGRLEEALAAFSHAAALKPAAAGECWRRLKNLLAKREAP